MCGTPPAGLWCHRMPGAVREQRAGYTTIRNGNSGPRLIQDPSSDSYNTENPHAHSQAVAAPSRLPLRRSARPILENLEIRLTLSAPPVPVGAGTHPTGPLASPSASQGPVALPVPPNPTGAAQPTILVYHAPGTYPAGDTPGPYGILPYDNGYATPAGLGYSPQQIRAAYGVNNIVFGFNAG